MPLFNKYIISKKAYYPTDKDAETNRNESDDKSQDPSYLRQIVF